MSEGIVYVLTHPAMEGYVKIGRTGNLEERLRNLYNSSVPGPFQCFYAAKVGDMETIERDLHEIFGDKRVDPKREFFSVEPHRAARALRMVAVEEIRLDGTTAQEDLAVAQRVDQLREQRDRFNFAQVDIAVGSVLTYIDRPEVTCTVVQQAPPRVEYNGRMVSLSAAAQEIEGKRYGVNGTLYWEFEGSTLSELREQ